MSPQAQLSPDATIAGPQPAPLAADIARFVDAFEHAEASRDHEPGWLRRLRREAIDRFRTTGFPTTSDEDYKYTSLAPVQQTEFARRAAAASSPDIARLRAHLLGGCDRVVLVDGRLSDELSSLDALADGVAVASLSEVIRGRSRADLLELTERRLARTVDSDRPLPALNTALFDDGLVIHLAAGRRARRPLQILHVSSGDATRASHPRSLLIAGAGSQATVIETHVGLGDRPYLTNAVTELVLEPAAAVEHLELQLEGPAAMHLATIEAVLQRDSKLRSLSASFGASLARADITARLVAPGCACSLDGIYLAGRQQHVDHHTEIDHRQPDCTSQQRYRGVIGGSATAVFNGKIFVRAGAIRTDAQQSNRNLLLSDAATINTKPQLEIFADDVRCTHGATVGQLDEGALFYLRSRGLGEQQARRILVSAFAAEVLDGVAHEPVRRYLEDQIDAWLSTSDRPGSDRGSVHGDSEVV